MKGFPDLKTVEGPLEASSGRPKCFRISRKKWRKFNCDRDSNEEGSERCEKDLMIVDREKSETSPKKRMGLRMTFQVAEVKKPLMAVKRLTQGGNHVSFEPKREDNLIMI